MEHQPEPTLVELIRYNNWANRVVLDACLQLNPEQLAAGAPGCYGSIHATLGHIIAAESSYVNRMTGSRPQPPFKWEDRPSLPEISSFAEQVAAALLETVQRVRPEQNVHEVEGGLTFDYDATVLYIQIINHGVEHRTNITTILSGMGLPAPEVDGWGYMEANREKFHVKEGTQS